MRLLALITLCSLAGWLPLSSEAAEVDRAPSGTWVTVRPAPGERLALLRGTALLPLPDDAQNGWLINPESYRMAVAKVVAGEACCQVATDNAALVATAQAERDAALAQGAQLQQDAARWEGIARRRNPAKLLGIGAAAGGGITLIATAIIVLGVR